MSLGQVMIFALLPQTALKKTGQELAAQPATSGPISESISARESPSINSNTMKRTPSDSSSP